MLNTTHPQPLKDMVYACQAYLRWHDDYETTQQWEALHNEVNFLNRMRDLLPLCLDIIKNDALLIDCE